ncbi:MAG: TonB family protein [Spirochaetaceae bacterium]|nr:TonB family protein [Myxococcales bacterium]MCB9724272.1 TonB family protein [Spirochaetaceae bacterium]
MRTILLAGLVLVSLPGCVSHDLLRFTLLSTALVPDAQDVELFRGAQMAHGETTYHSALIFFSWGTWSPQAATNAAIASVPGAVALVDGQISTESFGFLLYSRDRVVVQGTPLIDPRRAAEAVADVGSVEHCPPIRHPFDPPVPIRRVPANYPIEAMGSRIEGRVLVEFSVLRDGSTADVRVVAYEPMDVFNRTSILAVERWEFCPIPDGQPDYPNPRRVAIPFRVR